MITYKFGDIVLIGFPHTDLQGVSKRPIEKGRYEKISLSLSMKKVPSRIYDSPRRPHFPQR
jgi:hypothetical protein